MEAIWAEQIEKEKTDLPYSMLEQCSGVDGVDKQFFFTTLKF